VGKTTLSSALALLLSKRDRKVLLISTDPAHSLSDLFGVRGKEGKFLIEDRLCVREIDPRRAVREYIERVLRSLESLVSPDTLKEIKGVFRSIEESPGSEEAAVIEELSKIVLEEYNHYDHFVVDTAPTGHTLLMLRTIGRVGAWLEVLLKKKRSEQRFWFAGGSRKEDPTVPILEERIKRFSRFQKLLLSEETLFIPVLNPERLPIEETERLVRDLREMGIGVSFLIVNKVLPPNPRDEFLKRRKEQERVYLEEIRERFGDFKIIMLPMREKDIEGRDALEELSLELGRRLGI
jgi:arsenite-transporting ATPase